MQMFGINARQLPTLHNSEDIVGLVTETAAEETGFLSPRLFYAGVGMPVLLHLERQRLIKGTLISILGPPGGLQLSKKE